MFWALLFLMVAVLVVYVGVQLLRLIVVLGAVLVAGAYAVVKGLLWLGLLSGVGSFLLFCHFSNNPTVAACLAVVVGVSVPVFVGRTVLKKARGFIDCIQERNCTEKTKNHLLEKQF